mgnify:CR=1 FL=1|jgi:hypothetical protein
MCYIMRPLRPHTIADMPNRYVVQCRDDPEVLSVRLLNAKVSLLVY